MTLNVWCFCLSLQSVRITGVRSIIQSAVLGIEPRASYMLDKPFTHWPAFPALFCFVLEIKVLLCSHDWCQIPGNPSASDFQMLGLQEWDHTCFIIYFLMELPMVIRDIMYCPLYIFWDKYRVCILNLIYSQPPPPKNDSSVILRYLPWLTWSCLPKTRDLRITLTGGWKDGSVGERVLLL